jgi:MFS family permease
MGVAQVTSFGELLSLRIMFAAAQATQNPICFSLIPELFPRHRTCAMAAYNSAIYMGRALSFAAVIIAGQLGLATGDIGVTMVRACVCVRVCWSEWDAGGLLSSMHNGVAWCVCACVSLLLQ